MPRINIWLPDSEEKHIREAAKEATKTGGLGAYFVKLHWEKVNKAEKGK
jgi:hypothetical protein